MFLAYFWYFENIFIFRVPICELIVLFSNRWQPWKSNLIPYSCWASSKTCKSAIWFSGFPKIACQGCHISLGRNCPNPISLQDVRQIASLHHHSIGFHGGFFKPFSILNWGVLVVQHGYDQVRSPRRTWFSLALLMTNSSFSSRSRSSPRAANLTPCSLMKAGLINRAFGVQPALLALSSSQGVTGFLC